MATMANTIDSPGLGPKKTFFIMVTVVGCIAILWPKVFYPMMFSGSPIKNKIIMDHRGSGCCDVVLDTDKFGNVSQSIGQASVRKRLNLLTGEVTLSIRQERPPHLRPDSIHPAMRERGRAIPTTQTIPIVERAPPVTPRIVEGRPGPIPGMRPPMGAGSLHQPQPKSNTMGFVMPLYTIGIVSFFIYTIMKIVFKKSATTTPQADTTIKSDPEFHKQVFNQELPSANYIKRPDDGTTKLGCDHHLHHHLHHLHHLHHHHHPEQEHQQPQQQQHNHHHHNHQQPEQQHNNEKCNCAEKSNLTFKTSKCLLDDDGTDHVKAINDFKDALLNRKINQLTEIIQNSEKQKELDKCAVEKKRENVNLETAVAVVASELLTKQHKSVEDVLPEPDAVLVNEDENIIETTELLGNNNENPDSLVVNQQNEQMKIKEYSNDNDSKEKEQLLEINVLRKKLQETESAMANIIARMGNAPASLNTQDLTTANGTTANGTTANGTTIAGAQNISNGHAKNYTSNELIKNEQNIGQKQGNNERKKREKSNEKERPTVKVLGMEMTASCEGGQKWVSGRPPTPTLFTHHQPHRSNDYAEEYMPRPTQQIYLEGSLPHESKIIVTDAQTRTELIDKEADDDEMDEPAVVLSSKMTLSLISLDPIEPEDSDEEDKLAGNNIITGVKQQDVTENTAE